MKTETKVRLSILVIMMVVNSIAQIYEAQLEAIHYCSWIVFLSNIMFYAISDEDMKHKLITTLTGSVTGLLQAYALIIVRILLSGLGINVVIATIIPLGIILSCNIMLTHKLPYICNNVTLIYFNVALINSADLYANIIPDLIWCVAGFIVMTGLCVAVQIYLIRQARKEMVK